MNKSKLPSEYDRELYDSQRETKKDEPAPIGLPDMRLGEGEKSKANNLYDDWHYRGTLTAGIIFTVAIVGFLLFFAFSGLMGVTDNNIVLSILLTLFALLVALSSSISARVLADSIYNSSLKKFTVSFLHKLDLAALLIAMLNGNGDSSTPFMLIYVLLGIGLIIYTIRILFMADLMSSAPGYALASFRFIADIGGDMMFGLLATIIYPIMELVFWLRRFIEECRRPKTEYTGIDYAEIRRASEAYRTEFTEEVEAKARELLKDKAAVAHIRLKISEAHAHAVAADSRTAKLAISYSEIGEEALTLPDKYTETVVARTGVVWAIVSIFYDWYRSFDVDGASMSTVFHKQESDVVAKIIIFGKPTEDSLGWFDGMQDKVQEK